MIRRKRPTFKKDKRRKHHHWQVTVYYSDGEKYRIAASQRNRKHSSGRIPVSIRMAAIEPTGSGAAARYLASSLSLPCLKEFVTGGYAPHGSS
jgi:hypothetical protein